MRVTNPPGAGIEVVVDVVMVVAATKLPGAAEASPRSRSSISKPARLAMGITVANAGRIVFRKDSRLARFFRKLPMLPPLIAHNANELAWYRRGKRGL